MTNGFSVVLWPNKGQVIRQTNDSPIAKAAGVRQRNPSLLISRVVVTIGAWFSPKWK